MYEQKICYIDLYRNGVKCGNMGHVRMEWDGEQYRFGANLCHMDRQTLVTAVLERTGGRPRTTLQNIAIIHGKGSASSDWMPLEGSEERLLFQASGEIYGVCRLPKMREEGKPEKAEEKEPAEPDFRADVQEHVFQPEEKGEDLSETFFQPKEKQGNLPETMLREETDLQAEVRQNAKPEAFFQPEEKQGNLPETMLRRETDLQAEVRQNAKPETFFQPKEKGEDLPEEFFQPEEKTRDLPEVTLQTERKPGGMLDAVLRTMEKKGEKQSAVREAEGQNAVKETVVLTYPQAMEQRRQRERHVTALSDDKWKQLCSIYPTVHPIGDDVDFIKIAPADFVILRQEYQNLVRNSFLLHGYYNYNHVLLGRYPDKYYIGVPGIMHEQERLAAAMFGFVGFERAEAPKEQRENRDRFGYYMMEVGI